MQSSGLSSYRQALRIPGALAFSATGAVARLPMAMVGLGAVLMISGLGRSYTLAGLVAGTISLAQGIASPVLSRLIDHHGQRKVVLPQLAGYAAALSSLVVAAHYGASGWILFVAAVCVGISLPQFGACARARWTALLGRDPAIDSALAIESLIDEAVFVVGPVLVATLATSTVPEAGLLAAMSFTLIGGLLFVAQRSTEPPVRPSGSSGSGQTALRHRGLVVLVALFFSIGVMMGLIEVGVAALTRRHGHPAAAGAMLALWSVGSLSCGLVYGAKSWRTAASRRLQLGAAGLTAGCVAVAITAGSLAAMTVALVAAGAAIAPTLITGNTLVPTVVPHTSTTEAYTWLMVAIFAGMAVGSPLGGALIDDEGARAAPWASCLAGALALVVSTVGRSSLTPQAVGQSPLTLTI